MGLYLSGGDETFLEMVRTYQQQKFSFQSLSAMEKGTLRAIATIQGELLMYDGVLNYNGYTISISHRQIDGIREKFIQIFPPSK